jgi:predicted outer membrane protein
MMRGPLGGLVVAIVLAACSGRSSTGASPVAGEADGAGEGGGGGEGGAGEESGGGGAQTCSDGAIAAVLAAEERADLDVAMAVRDRLESPDAVAFAEKEITDHTLLLLQLQGAVRADAVSLPSSDDADATAQSAKLAVQSLATLAGAALDRAYLARAVLVHLEQSAVLDRLLAPAVRDARVTADVQHRREILAEHLTAALKAQASVAGSCG